MVSIKAALGTTFLTEALFNYIPEEGQALWLLKLFSFVELDFFFLRYADSMLMDVDKRIRKGKQRLALSLKDALTNVTTGDAAVSTTAINYYILNY